VLDRGFTAVDCRFLAGGEVSSDDDYPDVIPSLLRTCRR
jgi:hypothetical protein